MQTKKLYYEDAYLREFTAEVLACEQNGGKWSIVLDQSAFYPEGGGQPADHGALTLMDDANGADKADGVVKADAAGKAERVRKTEEAGEAVKAEDDSQVSQPVLDVPQYIKVEDVHEKSGVIVHTCDKPLAVGSTVRGRIDWARRFEHMQQHSGEHIVSGLICSRFHGSNVGFHMGADMVTIDFDVAMTWEDAAEIEAAANAYISENHPLEILWPSAAELEALEYRSKKELSGAVRIVRFAGADICACCGTHVSSSSQVGFVKLISCQKHKGGTRIEMLAGRRALDYLSRIWSENLSISHMLSAKPLETSAAVVKVREELLHAQERISVLLSGEFDRLAEHYKGHGDTLIVYDVLSPDDTRKLCDRVAGVCGGLCAVFAGGDGHYNYAIISGKKSSEADRADAAQSSTERVKSLVKELNAALNGRGGGRDGWAQGSVNADEAAIRGYFNKMSIYG